MYIYAQGICIFCIYLANSYIMYYYFNMKCKISLLTYVDDLQSKGKYWFSKAEYLLASNSSDTAFKQASNRLIKQSRIAIIAKGFYVIVPLEYKKRGILPASWYVDSFMQHINVNYYVGLLSAASYYGVTHQQPQIFQTVVNKQLALGKNNKTNLSFLVRKYCNNAIIQKQKTETGYINISTKETTTLDLVQYNHLSGYWNNVGTVLAELSETLNEELLIKAAINGKYEIPTLQRLGLLLDLIGCSHKSVILYEYLKTQKPRYVLLTPEYSKVNALKNKKWHVFVNDKIEIDV